MVDLVEASSSAAAFDVQAVASSFQVVVVVAFSFEDSAVVAAFLFVVEAAVV